MKERRVKFRYMLSDFVLFSATFSLKVSKYTLGQKDKLLEPEELWDGLPFSADGLAYLLCPIETNLPRLSFMANMIRYVPFQYQHYFVDLTGSFESYLKNFSSKTRSTLKRKVRKFGENSGGKIYLRTYSSPEEMEEYHLLAQKVAIKTYQKRLLKAALPESDEFQKHMQQLASNDCVRGYLLFIEKDKPVAYLYCPISNGVLEYAYLGYDAKYSKLSPGTVLQYCALRDLFQESNHRFFDFGEGEGEHKRLFATGSTLCANIYFFRATIRNKFLVCLHWATERFSECSGRILEVLHVKKFIKAFIRRKL